jgi:DNA-binding response OmpR family regulator
MGQDFATLSTTDRAVLEGLASRAGTVVSRQSLRRMAGIVDLSERRCDASIGAIRRALGDDSIRTVRSRGWMLNAEYLDQAVELLDSESHLQDR